MSDDLIARLRARLDEDERVAIAVAAPAAVVTWRCSRCGAPRWVAASLTGPVSHGGRAIKQCVPCGWYSHEPVEDEEVH